MPREIRKIILDEKEVIDAVESFRRVRKDLLPPGAIFSTQNDAEENLCIEIEMKFGPNVRKDTFILSNAHVVEAMVRFCLENNIMVPRGGKKSARSADQSWILEIRLRGSELEQSVMDRPVGMAARVTSGISILDNS